jgi:regulator of nucleoside diphosphate kinase
MAGESPPKVDAMSATDSHSDKHDDLKRRLTTRPAPAMHAPAAPAPRRDDCVLTSRDHALLEAWLMRALDSELEIDPVLIALVRAKLAAARIVLSGDVEADRARGGSRVVYTLDGGAPTAQLLAHWRPEAVAQSILPITSILGICLLGMRAGQRVPLVRRDGSYGAVWLDAVDPQTEPPSKHQEASALGAEAEEPARQATRPSAGAAHKVLSFPTVRRGHKPFSARRPAGPDDPDPAAA